MGRNLDDNVYIEIPFKKDSPVYARLKEEAKSKQTSNKKKVALGPYISFLLMKRDEEIQKNGEIQKKIGDMTVEEFLSIVSFSGLNLNKVEKVIIDKDEEYLQEAAKLAEFLKDDDFGDDED